MSPRSNRATRARRATFTLIEMLIVIVIISVLLAVVIPSMRDMTPTDATPASVVPLADVIRAAQRAAVDSARVVHLVIDPSTSRYEVRLMGKDTVFAQGTVDLPGGASMSTDSVRAQWWFDATGAAIGDSMEVSGGGWGSQLVRAHPWTGSPVVRPW